MRRERDGCGWGWGGGGTDAAESWAAVTLALALGPVSRWNGWAWVLTASLLSISRGAVYKEGMLKTAFRTARRMTPAPAREIIARGYEGILRKLPLKTSLKLHYFKSFQRFPDLNEPKLFSEKCQAQKLARPPLGGFVDKVAVKSFVRERVGDEHIIPTLYEGAWLPPRKERNWPIPFVVKTNHGSGGNIFVREKPEWDGIEAKLKAFLAYDFTGAGLESYYGTFLRKVLVEPFIGNGKDLPTDYKVFTCGGEVQFIQVDTDREFAHKRTFFDAKWNRLPIRLGYPEDTSDIPRPNRLDKMLEIAAELGRGFSFVRVDLYSVGDRVYFGELGFAPDSGLMKFEPAGIDAELGSKWAWPPQYPLP